MSTTPVSDIDGTWPSPGVTLAARYEIVEVIGRGGSSVIYRAREAGLGRHVAVKVIDLRRGGERSAEQRKQRFYRSARIMAQLNAPSTVTMLDYGRTNDGLLFVVFEFVDGETLEQKLRGGPLDEERARSILLQILESLREAHALGFLHRDIKPANVMLYQRLGQPDGVKVLDYGIAKKVSDDVDRDITMAGEVVGTPRYFAPERLAGKPASPASDLFSVGLLTYEMLVGQSPVAHLSGVELMKALSSRRFELPAAAKVSDDLREVVDGMLTPEPHRRQQSVDEVLAALGVHLEPIEPTGASGAEALVTFPVDLDPYGSTPVDELTGTTNVQSLTVTTSSMTLPASAAEGSGDELPSQEDLGAPAEDTRDDTSRRWWPWIVGLLTIAGAGLVWALFPDTEEPRESSSPDGIAAVETKSQDRPAAEPDAMVFEQSEEQHDSAAVGSTVARSRDDVERAVRFARMAADLTERSQPAPDQEKEVERPTRRKPEREPTKPDPPTSPGYEIEAMDELE